MSSDRDRAPDARHILADRHFGAIATLVSVEDEKLGAVESPDVMLGAAEQILAITERYG